MRASESVHSLKGIGLLSIIFPGESVISMLVRGSQIK
jgi:hypothetical protein